MTMSNNPIGTDGLAALETFAAHHDTDIDALGLDREALVETEVRMKKASFFEHRGMAARAETLRREAASAIDVPLDREKGGNEPAQRAPSTSFAIDVLNRYDMDTLTSKHLVEKETDTLARKRDLFASRNMPNRAAEFGDEIAVPEAAWAEVSRAGQPPSSIETLANRATREGYVLE